MVRRVLLAMITALGAASVSAWGAELFALPASSTYLEVKTLHEQFLGEQPSRQARLQALRDIVRASPYGERGLKHIFKNFEGAHAIDPRIQGVEQSVRLLTLPNKRVPGG